MSIISYVSVHEREDGKRKITRGKGDRTQSTIRIPQPDNELESFESHEWERVPFYELPRQMNKSEFQDWWNDNVGTEDEPGVIDKVLRDMGERGESQ